jgi:Fur family transcriptional regulator, zinc uptake regulator
MTMTNLCGCEHDPATWAARVETSCHKQGIHLTPLRKRVLDILSASEAPLGAYAILEEMSRREGKAFAPPTVYRTLDFFREHGFIHKIESLNAYAACEHLDHAHHAMLLICKTCGRSEELENAHVMAAISEAAGEADFVPDRVMIEAQGLCGRCAAQRGRERGHA